jgi:hypothetical protein
LHPERYFIATAAGWWIGVSYAGNEAFSGAILDGGYYNGIRTSTQLTALAAYSRCNAGG